MSHVRLQTDFLRSHHKYKTFFTNLIFCHIFYFQIQGFKWRPNIWRGFGHPGWRHWWWQQHHGNQGGPWGQHCRYQQEGENTEEQQQQQQGEGQQQQCPGGAAGGNAQEDCARDFMQHVGEQVAEMLDPLGKKMFYNG